MPDSDGTTGRKVPEKWEPVSITPRLYPPDVEEVTYPKYDWALRRWHPYMKVEESEIFYNADLREYRLDRYLLHWDELVSTIGQVLVNRLSMHGFPEQPAPEVLGEIVHIEVPGDKPGYWIVRKDEKLDLVLGQIGVKPYMVAT